MDSNADTDATLTDLDRLSVAPPDGCADPYLWALARTMFAQHAKTAAGECVTCPRWKACRGNALARDGLATAMGQTVKESAYWINYAALTAAQERRDRHAAL